MSLAKLSSAFLRRGGASSLLPLFHRQRLDGLLFFSSATTGAASEGDYSFLRPHFMVAYLINSCGFSSAGASKATKFLAHLKSTERPDAFLGFMRNRGFDDAGLRKIVSFDPKFLCCDDADKLLAPRFRFFQELGFSGTDLTRLFLSNPDILRINLHRSIQPRLEFWTALLGSKEHLLKVLKISAWFLSTSIEKIIMPNLSLLRECGISDQRTALVLRKSPFLILRSPQKLRALMERVDGMGVPRSSGMFLWALWAISLLSEAKFNAKRRLLMSLGWSEVEFSAAFCKVPLFMTNSEKMLSTKMAFLVKEVGYGPSDVAFCPKLLMYSLERRLKPRHRVMQMLEASGFPSGKCKFSTLMNRSDEGFMDKFVIPHKEKVPGLLEMYTAACGKKGAM
ncbi:transcription termination factor MTERF8, chloroplastic [Elaeis guineensis]|uniref:Transcription termination factor MTERF2, chloroplastic n=1 Tax=Elaeis guineensis var. tenera TaxID=51953 RepID=A0A6I9QY48_ELAGV|nr:transcription termination factor MTERF2, chloroplastic [Elaeis guineensis]